MSLRHAARRVAISVAATAAAGTFAALAFTASPAGASGPTTGTVIPNAAQCSDTCTGGVPFSSGQNINVVIPSNETFSSDDGLNNNNSGINIVECAAPNGVVPTNSANCDGNTIDAGILPNPDGSFGISGFTVYALPDSIQLGEGTSGPKCGSTSATECILYIGNNQNDFTQPHLWSQPFFVTANSDDGGENPGDGTPEVPLAVILPLSAMGLLGGAVLIRRRRTQRAA
jgi:hypothetical protein